MKRYVALGFSFVGLIGCGLVGEQLTPDQEKCKAAIDKLIKSPASAEYTFYGTTEIVVEPGHVDAQNAFGAVVREYFRCLPGIGATETEVFFTDAEGNVKP